MNSVLTIEKKLPPDLWLPTAEQPTDQYLTENFASTDHPYEDIIDYGSFLVALVLWDQANSNRISLMPVTADIQAMHEAGYGISQRTLHHKYGGLGKLQLALGFYSREHKPNPRELLKRFQWIADYAYSLDPLPKGIRNVDDVINWGAARNLSPGRRKVYDITDGNTTPIRKMFQIERKDYRRQYTHLDIYRFCARVITENDGPISTEALDEKYADVFVSSPSATIRLAYGSYTRLLMEFGRLPATPRGLLKQDVLDFGVRWKIANNGAEIGTSTINRLSAEMRFPSRTLITNFFDDIPSFQEQTDKAYKKYLQFREYAKGLGVDYEVFQTVCHSYEATFKFESMLMENISVMRKLSPDWYSAHYVLNIVQNGFNLLNSGIMTRQLNEFTSALSRLGITSLDERRFIFSIVPRINADDAVKMQNTNSALKYVLL